MVESSKLILQDEFKVNDSVGPKGFVIIRDKNGKVLVKKHNMIVKSGRDHIFSMIIQNLFNADVDIKNNDNYKPSKYKISKMRFGTSSVETVFNRMYSEGSESVHLSYEGVTLIELTKEDIKINEIDRHPAICISKTLIFNNSANVDNICELELIMEDTNTQGPGEPKLFSRITFDIIPVTAGSEFTIEYYIYF